MTQEILRVKYGPDYGLGYIMWASFLLHKASVFVEKTRVWVGLAAKDLGQNGADGGYRLV